MQVQIVATGIMIDVPNNKNVDTFHLFVNIPSNDEHCLKVNLVAGKWYWCGVCNTKVKNREGWEYTFFCWEHHKKDGAHIKKLNSSS